MRKLSIFLALALFVFVIPVRAEAAYGEAPMLAEMVATGTLPPVAERLPEVPKIADELSETFVTTQIGNYGGNLRTATSAVNWNAHVFMGFDENLLTQIDMTSGIITPNIVENYEMSEDGAVHTFTLRKGLKWSDGTPVTIDDFAFAVEDFIMNEELNPVLNNNFRTGGAADGNPGTFEVIDDNAFRFVFDGNYAGFPVKLTTSSSWAGYTDTLKPAYILKAFHIDYADEFHGSLDAYYEYIKPFAAVLGYDDPTAESVWTYVFNQIDVTNWELSDPSDCLTSVVFEGLVDYNFPVLYPWMMETDDSNVQVYVRNPYYFKTDAAGNQLPYIDRVTSSYTENEQAFVMEVIAGNVDFSGVTNAQYMSLYLENEENGNYKYVTASEPATFGAVLMNMTYGLNTDGTVKDDEASQTFREMYTDIRFRQALMHAIDAEEVIDVVYHGLADVNDVFSADYDIEKANALLDEMGAIDIDGDGWRETPSGKPFQWQMWTQQVNDHLVFAELYNEYWHEIGLHCDVYVTESSLIATSIAANEVPMYIFYVNGPSNWLSFSWQFDAWAPLYNAWIVAGGLAGNEVSDLPEPPQDIKDFYNKMNAMKNVDAHTAANVYNVELHQFLGETLYIILPIVNCPSAITYSNDLGNVPTGGAVWTHTMNFDMDRLYFK